MVVGSGEEVLQPILHARVPRQGVQYTEPGASPGGYSLHA